MASQAESFREVEKDDTNLCPSRLLPSDETPTPTLDGSAVTMENQTETAVDSVSDQKDSDRDGQAEGLSEETEPQNEGGTEPTSEESTAADSIITDPYHYLSRQHFTSEIFKIEIQNLPRHFGFGQLKKMLCNLQLKPKKVKAVSKATYAFVTFSCQEDKETALKVLNGHKWKGKILKAKLAKPVQDPFTKSVALKRSQEESDESPKVAKRRKEEESLPLKERLNNMVTPLWKEPYEDQLTRKQGNTEQFLQNLAKQLQKNIREITPWLNQQRKKHKGMVCELGAVKPSPILENYRNKCEFTVGKSVDGQETIVGFRLGTYKDGHVSVVNPSACNHVCPATKSIVDAFQRYLQQESSLPCYDPQLHAGNWRMLLVRTSLQGGKMAAAFMHPQKMSKEAVEEERRKLCHFFRDGDGKSCQLSSLYLNLQDDSNKTYIHVDGAEHITEELLGLKFRISPDAFFQVNTKAAEVLYSTVADWANVSSSSTVLDICCGTGTIGITLAKRVKNVIGVEMNQQAVHDAIFNAEANGLSNIEYRCGKAEDILPDMMQDLTTCDDVVGIVDPPRPGMAAKVLQAIRRCSNLRRLLYVSCHPQNAIGNFIDLCRPISNRIKGIPFRPTRAVAIDLFPQTNHCELVILFERADQADSFYQVPDGVRSTPNADTSTVAPSTTD